MDLEGRVDGLIEVFPQNLAEKNQMMSPPRFEPNTSPI
jgi:hypothetical protein